MCYTLKLTHNDVDIIAHSGYRYQWSDALRAYGAGTHGLAEHEAWELNDAFEADTEGGHCHFPGLMHDSVLAGKLFSLMDEIV